MLEVNSYFDYVCRGGLHFIILDEGRIFFSFNVLDMYDSNSENQEKVSLEVECEGKSGNNQ